jgi:hypothetical protein
MAAAKKPSVGTQRQADLRLSVPGMLERSLLEEKAE